MGCARACGRTRRGERRCALECRFLPYSLQAVMTSDMTPPSIASCHARCGIQYCSTLLSLACSSVVQSSEPVNWERTLERIASPTGHTIHHPSPTPMHHVTSQLSCIARTCSSRRSFKAPRNKPCLTSLNITHASLLRLSNWRRCDACDCSNSHDINASMPVPIQVRILPSKHMAVRL